MRLATFLHHGAEHIGAVAGSQITVLSAVAPDMLALISLGADGLAKARHQVETATETIPLASVDLQAPIPSPARNLMCLGLNYTEHAHEHYGASGAKAQVPDFPIVFTKATTVVAGPHDDIPFDPKVSTEIDWEVELAVVIGRSGKNISRGDALEYVYGYTIFNDVSARDLQRQGKQYFKGKSLDGFGPMGPWIVTADEMPNAGALRITSRVNGVTKQDSNTAQLIFDIPEIIAHLSRGMTLLAGDIIATGTPGGVGFARTPPEFLRPGDVVECEIESIGLIRNKVENA